MSNKKPTKKPVSKGKFPSSKKEERKQSQIVNDDDGGDTFLTDMMKRKPSNRSKLQKGKIDEDFDGEEVD